MRIYAIFRNVQKRIYQSKLLQLAFVALLILLTTMLFALYYDYYSTKTSTMCFKLQQSTQNSFKTQFLVKLIEDHSDLKCASAQLQYSLFPSRTDYPICKCTKRKLTATQKRQLSLMFRDLLEHEDPGNYSRDQYARYDTSDLRCFVSFNDESLKWTWWNYYIYLYTEILGSKSISLKEFGTFKRRQTSPSSVDSCNTIAIDNIIDDGQYLKIDFYKLVPTSLKTIKGDPIPIGTIYLRNKVSGNVGIPVIYSNTFYPIDWFINIFINYPEMDDYSFTPYQMNNLSSKDRYIYSFDDFLYFSFIIISSFGSNDIEPATETIRWVMLVEVLLVSRQA